MKKTTVPLFATLFALTIGLSVPTVIAPNLLTQAFAQDKNETLETGMKNMSNATGTSGKIPSLSTPGEKTIHIFTSEIERVDEQRLKVAGDYYSEDTIIVNKGDKVTIHFYNVDDVKTERHSFTIGDPYKVDIDLGFGQSGNATFTADHTGLFKYYCRYHLPVMTGELLVLP